MTTDTEQAAVSIAMTALRERDEALAQVAALREAAINFRISLNEMKIPVTFRRNVTRFNDALTNALTATSTVAAARDAALVERGRREGIKAAHADLLARGMNTSALIVACLLPDDDAPGEGGGR